MLVVTPVAKMFYLQKIYQFLTLNIRENSPRIPGV